MGGPLAALRVSERPPRDAGSAGSACWRGAGAPCLRRGTQWTTGLALLCGVMGHLTEGLARSKLASIEVKKVAPVALRRVWARGGD